MKNIIVILTIGLLAFSSFAGQRQPNDIRFTGYTWLEHNKELSVESGVFSVDSASTASIAADLTLSGATTISGALLVNNTLTVGADGTSFDVLFYSDTAGDTMLWDASAKKLIITGTAASTALDVADGNVSITDDLDVDGTTNLDAVDIDGAVQIDGAVTVGTTGVGQDVIFESNTAGDLLQWSATDVTLYVTGTDSTTALDVRDGNVVIDDDLTVDGSLIQNALSGDGQDLDVADDAEITLTAAAIGFGFAMIGDGEEYALWVNSADGTVVLVSNSANAVNTDTDAKFCIYDAGTGVAIKNRLGSQKTVRYIVNYSL